jgi:very-short-patch-repair endonuclease
MGDFSRHKNIPKYLTALSRQNRLAPTIQEEMLWNVISGRKLNGLKFRRQFPIGRYVVDFYNHSNKLVIEADGEIHGNQKEYDAKRDEYLKACGLKVIRFTNKEIESDLPGVIKTILSFTSGSPPAGDLGGEHDGRGEHDGS